MTCRHRHGHDEEDYKVWFPDRMRGVYQRKPTGQACARFRSAFARLGRDPSL